MSDSEHPPIEPDVPATESRPPSDPKRRRLEGVIPELIKRAVEIGVEKAAEAPGNIKELVGNTKLPKEIASLLLAQAEETKNGLFRVVAKEVRDFLEHTNMAGEMQKMLTTVQFEISTTIRFKPNDQLPTAEGDDERGDPKKLSKPEVKTRVEMTQAPPQRRERRRTRD
jgi:hypothetical protein